jgi:uracil DNA glycosylase
MLRIVILGIDPYPKPGLPMLRIVFLGIDPYPKPFKQTRGVCLAFLTLIRSIKQACFAASH